MKPVIAACVLSTIWLSACGPDQGKGLGDPEDQKVATGGAGTGGEASGVDIDLSLGGARPEGTCFEGGWIGAQCAEETDLRLGIRITLGERFIYLDEPADKCRDVYARAGSCVNSNLSLEATNRPNDRLELMMDDEYIHGPNQGRSRYRLKKGVLVEATGTVWTFSETGADDYPLIYSRSEVVYKNEFDFIATSDAGSTASVQVEITACNAYYACLK